MVGLAFAIAASGNFPALLMSILWKKFTTNGAFASMLVGTLSPLLLIYLSPAIQIDLLKNASAIFPLKNPGLITIPLSFIVGILVSLSKKENESEEKFSKVVELVHLGDAQFPATLPPVDVDVEL